VNEIGLKTEYETNGEVHSYVRCLPALAFIPLDDVMKAFELLDESQPTTVHQLDELTTFFELTFVAARAATFPVETWNQHAAGSGGIARSTNSVEGWHRGSPSNPVEFHDWDSAGHSAP